MSQSKLAREIGVSPQSVQLWESGKNLPKRFRINKLASILQVSPMDLEFGNIECSTLESSSKPWSYENLTDKEQLLISRFRQLEMDLQDHLILIAESGIEDIELTNMPLLKKQTK